MRKNNYTGEGTSLYHNLQKYILDVAKATTIAAATTAAATQLHPPLLLPPGVSVLCHLHYPF